MGTVFRDRNTGRIVGYNPQSGASQPSEVYRRRGGGGSAGTSISVIKPSQAPRTPPKTAYTVIIPATPGRRARKFPTNNPSFRPKGSGRVIVLNNVTGETKSFEKSGRQSKDVFAIKQAAKTAKKESARAAKEKQIDERIKRVIERRRKERAKHKPRVTTVQPDTGRQLTGSRVERFAQKTQKREQRIDDFTRTVYQKLKIDRKFQTAEGKFLYRGNVLKTVKGGFIELVKGAARLPFEVAKIPMVIGGRVALVQLARFDRQYRKKLTSKATLKKTGVAVVKGFDPRTPDGVLNIVLTVAAVRSLARTKMLNNALERGKVTSARVVSKSSAGGKVTSVKEGFVKYKGNSFPFREVIKANKGKILSRHFTRRSLKGYRVRDKAFSAIKEAAKLKRKAKWPKLKRAEARLKTLETRLRGMSNRQLKAQRRVLNSEIRSIRKMGLKGRGIVKLKRFEARIKGTAPGVRAKARSIVSRAKRAPKKVSRKVVRDVYVEAKLVESNVRSFVKRFKTRYTAQSAKFGTVMEKYKATFNRAVNLFDRGKIPESVARSISRQMARLKSQFRKLSNIKDLKQRTMQHRLSRLNEEVGAINKRLRIGKRASARARRAGRKKITKVVKGRPKLKPKKPSLKRVRKVRRKELLKEEERLKAEIVRVERLRKRTLETIRKAEKGKTLEKIVDSPSVKQTLSKRNKFLDAERNAMKSVLDDAKRVQNTGKGQQLQFKTKKVSKSIKAKQGSLKSKLKAVERSYSRSGSLSVLREIASLKSALAITAAYQPLLRALNRGARNARQRLTVQPRTDTRPFPKLKTDTPSKQIVDEIVGPKKKQAADGLPIVQVITAGAAATAIGSALVFSPLLATVATGQFIRFGGGKKGPGSQGGIPFGIGRRGSITQVASQRFFYVSDLASRLHGVKATPRERRELLRPGRIFSGVEWRPKIG